VPGTWAVRVIRELNANSFFSVEKIPCLPGREEAKGGHTFVVLVWWRGASSLRDLLIVGGRSCTS
jgi:hypothetical protein